MKFITNLKIKHKLQVTGILYLLLIAIVIYFFISSNALIKKSSEQQHSLNSLSADIQHLETAVKDYVYDSISINDLNQLFEQLGGRIKKTTLAENFAGIQDRTTSFAKLRSRNEAIENEITTLTEASLAASNNVIKVISDRLIGADTRADVSNMERAVLVGANMNTNANFRIKVLFGKLKEDIGQKDSLIQFLDTLVANVTKDIELLKGTENEAAARQAKETNLKVKTLVLEFIDNVNSLNTMEKEIVGSITAMDASIGDLVDTLQLVPEHMTRIADSAETLRLGLLRVIARWSETIMIVTIILLALVIIYFGVPVLDELTRGWRMLLGLSPDGA